MDVRDDPLKGSTYYVMRAFSGENEILTQSVAIVEGIPVYPHVGETIKIIWKITAIQTDAPKGEYWVFVSRLPEVLHIGDTVQVVATGQLGKIDGSRDNDTTWSVIFPDGTKQYLKNPALHLIGCPHPEPEPGFVPMRKSWNKSHSPAY
jgi:hypothetical protein